MRACVSLFHAVHIEAIDVVSIPALSHFAVHLEYTRIRQAYIHHTLRV